MTEPHVTLTLLHTNDIHSHFEQASRIAEYVAGVRKRAAPDRLLVVDNGDFLDRARMETEGTASAVNRAMLEFVGYDATMLGNNEGLSYTPGELESIFGGMSVPIVCANMTLTDTGLPPSWMVPTLVLERAGVRIGLIGLTAAFTDYYGFLGWEAEEPIETLRREVGKLRPEVDALIVLSHLGLRHDQRIAADVPGIDVILGGHTHHLLEVPLLVNGTAICAAGKFGDYVGHLELGFDQDGRLASVTGGSLATEGWPASSAFDEMVDRYRTLAKSAMSRTIATLPEPLDALPDRETPLPTLLAAAIRRLTGAEIGLANAGQLLEGLPAGDVTAEKIHSICPSPINPCTIRLPGSLILRTLEESLLPEFQHMEIRGFGFRCKVLGLLCMDGLEATADMDEAPYGRVKDARVNGIPLDPNGVYTVATLDMFTFGVGYAALKEGTEVRYYLPEFIRDVLAEALNDEELIAGARIPRWRFP